MSFPIKYHEDAILVSRNLTMLKDKYWISISKCCCLQANSLKQIYDRQTHSATGHLSPRAKTTITP